MGLLKNALIKFVSGVVLLGVLLFLPAGTHRYPNGWLFMGLLFGPMLLLGVVLFFKAPELLKKRLNSKEKEKKQSGVVLFSAIMFIASFVLAGMDFRYGWSEVPGGVTAAAAVVQLGAYAMYAEVMRENAFLSRTVEIQEDQKVVDTGLYGIVRHPMYMATVFLYLAMPLVLGSWIAFAVMLSYPVMITFRIRNEEEVLEKGLSGYAEYKKRVKYRLIPFVW